MTEDFVVRFGLAVLATWRVSHLLASEDGPGAAILRVRRWLGEGPLGGLMDCFHCLSLWVAAVAAFLVASDPASWVLTWLAVSGGACLLEQATSPPEMFVQPMEDHDDVLR